MQADMPRILKSSYGDLSKTSFSTCDSYPQDQIMHVTHDVLPEERRVNINDIPTAWDLSEISNRIYKEEKEKMPKIRRRIVDIYIVDPDTRVAMTDALLHQENGKITEDADADLLYDIDIKGLLTEHNKKREATVDEAASENKEHDVYLKPIKPSQLSMQIIDIVQF